MIVATPEIVCPCESGLKFADCCSVWEDSQLNIIADISNTNALANEKITPRIQAVLRSPHANPDLFAARISFFDRTVQWVKMSRVWYHQSVFLDPARIRGRYALMSDLQWLLNVSENTPWRNCAYIFHTAFCGSTLMSQALAALYDSLPLREPEVLGNLQVYLQSQTDSDHAKHAWIDRVLRLLSRRYDDKQKAVIKANDYANPMMSKVLACRRDTPVLFMYTPLAEFLAGCLKADSRKLWIRQRFDVIRPYIARYMALPESTVISEDSFGAMAAVYWAYNLRLYLEARREHPERVRSLDFNQMLAQPFESIAACARFFDLTPLANANPQELADSLFTVYSKNNAYTYSPQQRNWDIKKLRDTKPQEFEAAERLARLLLASHYPDNTLPGNLLA